VLAPSFPRAWLTWAEVRHLLLPPLEGYDPAGGVDKIVQPATAKGVRSMSINLR